MPVQVSYPGVYIEEISSGVHTIIGVATSITAFIGRALRGPTDGPVIVNGFGDFERTFGALHANYPMGYSVRDFFMNGGSQAVIVRLFHDPAVSAAQAVADAAVGADAAKAATAADDKAKTYTSPPEAAAAKVVKDAADAASILGGATATSVKAAAQAAVPGAAPSPAAKLLVGAIPLRAAYPGKWGANLRASIDRDVSEDVATALSLTKDDLFNLTVRDTSPGGGSEKFLNLTVKESARRADRVLKDQSNLVRWDGTLDPNALPAIPAGSESDAVTKKEDLLATAQKNLRDKQVAGTAAQADKDAVKTANDDLTVAETTAANAVADSAWLTLKDFTPPNGEVDKLGLYLLERTDLFNLLCIPADKRDNGQGDESTDVTMYQAALPYCQKRRAMLIVDPPADWKSAGDITKDNGKKLTDLGLSGDAARNAALYFPRVLEADPNRGGQIAMFVPCGVVAGVMARTDVARGIWKAPAGLDASLNGVQGLAVDLTDAENGMLNPLGINCLRSFPVAGRVVWGARTLRGADLLADDYKYVPVRRLALYIEESLFRGTKWVVFEPNDEPLWAQIRMNVGAFMHNLFRQGAFQGSSARDAYLVKCDKDTTTQNDINSGIVNIVVGFAPLKPAEFVIIKIQQLAGQIET
jgi:phage tail sheath protein FI